MKIELSERLKFCPRCGRGYLPESAECSPCGIALPSGIDIELLQVEIREPPPRDAILPSTPQKLPDKLKVCPRCGATQAAMLTVCPDCRTRMAVEPDIDITEIRGIESPFAGGASAYSLSSLLALTTLVAMGCALLAIHPALAMLFAVLVTPAAVITAVRVRERQSQGKAVPWHEHMAIFLHSLALTVGAILLVGGGILLVMFFVGCLVVVFHNALGL